MHMDSSTSETGLMKAKGIAIITSVRPAFIYVEFGWLRMQLFMENETTRLIYSV